MSNERLYKVILGPHVTEKSHRVADKHNQIVFRVATTATKQEIKSAVELLFKVKVKTVQVANMKGKVKRFGRTEGKRNDWRKAYVSLEEGHDISFAGGTAE